MINGCRAYIDFTISSMKCELGCLVTQHTHDIYVASKLYTLPDLTVQIKELLRKAI